MSAYRNRVMEMVDQGIVPLGIPLIEHPDAVENIEEICALPEVSTVIFGVGVGDLSFALGEGMVGDLYQASQKSTLSRPTPPTSGFPAR